MLQISKRGYVTNIEVEESTHEELEKPTLRAVKKWRFYTILRNGKAMPFTDTGHIIFKIKDS